jgi:uncharacterized protein (UPF0332 family)
VSAFDWSEYLVIADDLRAARAPTASEEARSRAAVSRAYYAAFCAARDFLVDLGEVSPAHDDEPRLHGDVMRRFKQASDGRRVKIGRWLDSLRAARNRCDYESEVAGTRELAERASIQARWTLEHLAKLRGA